VNSYNNKYPVKFPAPFLSFFILTLFLTPATHLSAQKEIENQYQAATQKNSFLTAAKKFLQANENLYQITATEADIDKVLNFCEDSIEYDHFLSAKRKFSFSGKSLWRSGAVSHLGETRNVRLKILNIMTRQNMVVVEYNLSREIKENEDWKRSDRIVISIMEFNKNGKIKKLTDYL
jgi:hypothetical protein